MLLALILSPIYLWSSGLPQLSHWVAVLAIGLRLILKPRLYWERCWSIGAVFVLYTFVVALIVFAIHGDLHTILSPAYYTFGFLVFLFLVTLSKEESKAFLPKVFWIHLIALIILTALSVLGVGRSFGEVRAMGTFNDPNQMANWVLWTTIIIGVAGRALYGSWLSGLFALGLAFLGVVYTASRSGALGLFALLTVYGFMGFHSMLRFFLNRARIRLARGAVLGIVTIVLVVVFGIASMASARGEQTGYILNQIKFWLSRFQESSPYSTFEGRGYDRIWKFPEYLVFGAGEGAHERYADRTWFLGEIHSSWAGLLFNYGLVGVILFFSFVYVLLRRIQDMWFKLMLLAPFMYGFATYNIRNWYFWVGLALLCANWQLLRERQDQGKRENFLEKEVLASVWPFFP